MIHRLHEIIKKMRSDVRLGAASIYVLDELERRINQIDPLDGVYIDEDEIAVYDPLTGKPFLLSLIQKKKRLVLRWR